MVTVPLGPGIGELWDAVRDRVEVSGSEPVWDVTAGSFDSALTYARERFEDPAVLARKDRGRLWSRVTLTVTTDTTLAASAPRLEDVASPVVPEQATPSHERGPDAADVTAVLPPSLEAIFAHQDRRRV